MTQFQLFDNVKLTESISLSDGRIAFEFVHIELSSCQNANTPVKFHNKKKYINAKLTGDEF